MPDVCKMIDFNSGFGAAYLAGIMPCVAYVRFSFTGTTPPHQKWRVVMNTDKKYI